LPFRETPLKTRTRSFPNCSECPLSGAGVIPGNFVFHLMFFPAAGFLAGEEFGVVAAVAGITAIARNVMNLFPNPSLSWHNERFAVGALVRAVDDHVSSSYLDAKRRPRGRPRMD
jgi:hypothetical protein